MDQPATRTVDQKIIALYDEYTHVPLPRRVFLDRLSRLAGGTAAALALLPLLENNYAAAAIVAPDDGRIDTSRIEFPGKTGAVNGYLAAPKGDGRHPAVVVIHENRGLNPHIEDITRRLATDGFLAMAPDALTPLGGTPSDEDRARDMIGTLDNQDTLGNLLAAVTWLKAHGRSNGRVGAVGFCWGGGWSNQLAVHSRDLNAAVVFYGRSPRAADVPKIGAPLLLHYAGLDERINKDVPAYEKALKDHGKQYTLHMYDGVNHAFNNDTGGRYDKAAATLAWERTVAFLRGSLGG